jgi:hypothetical protein
MQMGRLRDSHYAVVARPKDSNSVDIGLQGMTVGGERKTEFSSKTVEHL